MLGVDRAAYFGQITVGIAGLEIQNNFHFRLLPQLARYRPFN